MASQRTSNAASRFTAVIALLAFVVTACGGASVSSVSADRIIDPAGSDPAALEASPVDSSAASGPTAPATGTDHQFGATIEEWTANKGVGDDVGQSDYPSIEWKDLIPAGASGEELMARFQKQLAEVELGSPEAEALYEQLRSEYNPEAVNETLDGQKIRLAGFVAPLTYDDETVTEFLLVPTLGACIHVPPPPPNQTVMVAVDKSGGLTFEESWGAVWVEGTLVIEPATTSLAAASYTIVDATTGAYTDI